MKKLLAIGVGIFVSIQVMACSCMKLGKLTEEAYTQATDIFIGKAVEVDTLLEENLISIRFKVKESIKGAKVKYIEVTTPMSSAACGLYIQEGEKWYIFGSIEDGEMRVNMCGRHANLTKPGCKWFAKDKKLVDYNKERYKKNKARVKAEIELIDEIKKVSER